MTGPEWFGLFKLLSTRTMVLATAGGLVAWIWVSTGRSPWLFEGFAEHSEITALAAQLGAQIGHIQQQVTDESAMVSARYSRQINSQILDDLAKCHDSKNSEAQDLYERAITALVIDYRQINNGQDPPAAGGGGFCRG